MTQPWSPRCAVTIHTHTPTLSPATATTVTMSCSLQYGGKRLRVADDGDDGGKRADEQELLRQELQAQRDLVADLRERLEDAERMRDEAAADGGVARDTSERLRVELEAERANVDAYELRVHRFITSVVELAERVVRVQRERDIALLRAHSLRLHRR